MPPPPVAAAPREPAQPITPEAQDRLQRATAAPLNEASAPEALFALLEALRLRFGALLRYDSESQSLSMLAQEGLSPQAIDAIRLIRRGVGGVWDMPLHAVLQRRVYIIDKPKENPFVPPLLDGTEQGVLTNAALIPLFAGGTVTGALLLVGSGKRAVHETDILALRDVAKTLGAALRLPPKGARAPHVLTQPIAAPPQRDEGVRDRAMLTARISELESLVESLRRSATGGPTSAQADRRIAELTRERDRYKSEAALNELSLRNVRSEFDLLREQSTAESERGRKLALELARSKEELTAAVEIGHRSTAELEETDRARAELVERLTDLERQFGETATQVRSGEESRAELGDRLSAAEREAEELRKNLRAREEQISELRGERERLTASLQKAASRYQSAEDSIAQLREGTELAQAEQRGQIEVLQARLDAVERERDQLSAGLAGRAEIIREIERETEKFRTELARESERRRVAEQTSSSVIHDAAALRAEAERIQAERQMAQVEAERARAEVQQLAAELDTLRKTSQAEVERLRGRALELEKRAEQAETTRSVLTAELERLRPDLENHRRNAVELRSRDEAREGAERRLAGEVAELRKRLDEAMESARSLSRERDALAARAATLQETTANLMREGESLRAERERRDQELENVRVDAQAKSLETDDLAAELEALRGRVQRSEAELGEAREFGSAAVAQRQTLEQELGALREELERAQSRGSELTVELARRAQREEALQAAAAETHRQRDEAERARIEEEVQRKELQGRLDQLENALQGASADLAQKARAVDFAAVLRATLTKSESARRAAEEALARLQAALQTEQAEAAQSRAEVESEREAAQQLTRRLEEVERRLAESEESTAEANHRAALLAADQAAAQETTQSLAADLGRRNAELNELSGRLEAAQRMVQEREAAAAHALERAQALETTARAAAQEVEALRRQTNATQDEKDRFIHELELRMAEATARTERIAAEMKAGEEERERMREALRALENDRRQSSEGLREAAAKTAALEAAARRSQADAERLSAEVETARQRAASLESDLRGLEAESARWRGLAETLESTLENRDREMQALKSVPRPALPVQPGVEKPVAAKPAPVKPAIAKPSLAPRERVNTSKQVVILDDTGPAFAAFAQACTAAGFEAHGLANGARPSETPAYTGVNLLAGKNGGLDGLLRSRTEEGLALSDLFLYASKPGSAKGVVLPHVDCLIRPLEEKDFIAALSALLGGGKRVTIIGEELDSVLKLNAWATAKGCSVSSAGDLKQGNEILDIVKPDLIVFDFSRMGGEGASLVVKARRSPRLDTLPILLVLPAGGQSASASFFLKRLATLADETPFDFSVVTRRLAPEGKS